MKKFESLTVEGVYFCLFHLALGLLCICHCIAESLVCNFLINIQNDVQCVSNGIFWFHALWRNFRYKKNEINDSILIEEFLLAGDIHAFV